MGSKWRQEVRALKGFLNGALQTNYPLTSKTGYGFVNSIFGLFPRFCLMETLNFVMAVHERFLLIPNPSLATVIFEEKKKLFIV